ncbi:hypothetical protein EYV94_11460 [Puteibacter caeruleilacunae]|nr:hypothetical protein EYV94_11460 [Puteibacter caeruleilacunae]
MNKFNINNIKLLAVTIFVSLFGFCGCHNDPIKVSTVEGHEFISCNIDNIRDTANLMLSDISEYSEVVILAKDSALQDDDYIIDRTIVSEKYIVVIPCRRPALLYTREGEFIKRLVIDDARNPDRVWGISAEIDDEKDQIFLLVAGLGLYRFNAYGSERMRIPKYIDKSWNFVLLGGDRIMSTIYRRKQNIWGYIQSIYAPQGKLLFSRSSNDLFNLLSGAGYILKREDMPVLSFVSANDTCYYYDEKRKEFTPFMCCYSGSNVINFNADVEYPDEFSVLVDKVYKNKKRLKTRLLHIGERYSLFELIDGGRMYFVIDTKLKQAYFIKGVINDFLGDIEMNSFGMYAGRNCVVRKDGYFTFVYCKEKLVELIEEGSKLSLKNGDKDKLFKLKQQIEKLTDDQTVLLVSKLK